MNSAVFKKDKQRERTEKQIKEDAERGGRPERGIQPEPVVRLEFWSGGKRPSACQGLAYYAGDSTNVCLLFVKANLLHKCFLQPAHVYNGWHGCCPPPASHAPQQLRDAFVYFSTSHRRTVLQRSDSSSSALFWCFKVVCDLWLLYSCCILSINLGLHLSCTGRKWNPWTAALISLFLHQQRAASSSASMT